MKIHLHQSIKERFFNIMKQKLHSQSNEGSVKFNFDEFSFFLCFFRKSNFPHENPFVSGN